MRIYSLSRVIAFPFIMALAILLYLEFVLYLDIGWWLLAPLFGIIAIYMINGLIDHWWNERHPIPLDDEVRKLIVDYLPFYNKLDADDKLRFENRLSIYVDAREWKNIGTEEMKPIPDDMRAMIASQSIMMTFYQEDYLLGDFDRIYTYKHPFPSPKFQFLHTVETDIEDGLILYSMEHLLVGITNPHQYYNIGMHGYAEAYIKQHPTLQYPAESDYTWSDIEEITGFRKEQILGVLGFEQVDLLPVLINCYFTFPEKTREVLSKVYEEVKNLFS